MTNDRHVVHREDHYVNPRSESSGRSQQEPDPGPAATRLAPTRPEGLEYLELKSRRLIRKLPVCHSKSWDGCARSCDFATICHWQRDGEREPNFISLSFSRFLSFPISCFTDALAWHTFCHCNNLLTVPLQYNTHTHASQKIYIHLVKGPSQSPSLNVFIYKGAYISAHV